MTKLVLPGSLASAQDVRGVMIELQAYAHWQTHTATKRQLGVTSHMADTPPLSPASHELLAQQPDIETLLSSLQYLVDHAETISITLAGMASGGLKKAMVAWCRQHIAPDTLVSFDFSSSLLGGMVVRRGSHIYDWSFRRQLLAAQSKFPEVLRRV